MEEGLLWGHVAILDLQVSQALQDLLDLLDLLEAGDFLLLLVVLLMEVIMFGIRMVLLL